MALNVPHYDEDQLGASSVILADQMERVPTNSIGAGQFVIRSSKVRPRVNDTFKQGETMGIYAEFYNFGMDEKTKKPEGTIEYDVVNAQQQDGADPDGGSDSDSERFGVPGHGGEEAAVEEPRPRASTR